MAKYKTKQQPSQETVDEAMKIAKSTQRPNQNKEHTKIIAQGIQKGLAEYKKQQKSKAREQNKLKKKSAQEKQTDEIEDEKTELVQDCKTQWLPWSLLLVSWLGMGLYLSYF